MIIHHKQNLAFFTPLLNLHWGSLQRRAKFHVLITVNEPDNLFARSRKLPLVVKRKKERKRKVKIRYSASGLVVGPDF